MKEQDVKGSVKKEENLELTGGETFRVLVTISVWQQGNAGGDARGVF